jgi:acyl dehydratase
MLCTRMRTTMTMSPSMPTSPDNGSAHTFAIEVPLSDEMVAEAKAMIGMPIRTEGWNQQASRDAIRHYAYGLGDDNPLFCHVAYGAASCHGTTIAPPTFLYTINDAAICPGLPGLQWIYGGARWRFFRPVKLDEVLTSTTTLADVRERRGGAASRMLVQTGHCQYFAPDGELVGEVLSDTLRIARRSQDGGLHYDTRATYQYRPDELARIERDVLGEQRRGAEPRFADDVQVGDTLGPVVKGPIDQITMTAYYGGCPGSPGYKGCEIGWKYRDRAFRDPASLPDQYDAESYFGEQVLPSLGHQNPAVANAIGMPGAYNNGPQRVGWAAHLITDWMADAGWLDSLNYVLRRPEIFGDTVWVSGVVTSKRTEADRALVTCDIHSVNQLGEETALGDATVILPIRAR